MTEDEMVGWHHWLDGHEFESTLGVKDRKAWCAAVHGVATSRARRSDCTTAARVVAHGLSCCPARGVLLPGPGIKPTSSALEGGFLTTGPPGKSLSLHLLPLLFIPRPVASWLHNQILSERGTPESSLQAPRSPQPCRGPPHPRMTRTPALREHACQAWDVHTLGSGSDPFSLPPAGSRLPLHQHACFLGVGASSEAAERKDSGPGTGGSCQCLLCFSSCFA